jgi:hypothetical protein
MLPLHSLNSMNIWKPKVSSSPKQRHEAQTFDSAGASPATGTILECQRDKRTGPAC